MEKKRLTYYFLFYDQWEWKCLVDSRQTFSLNNVTYFNCVDGEVIIYNKINPYLEIINEKDYKTKY